MLCPEVCNFKFPSSSITVQSGSLNDDFCDEIINHHFYNHNVTAVFPGCDKIPEDFIKDLKHDCEYYFVNIPLSQLIEKDFINNFISCGQLSALSVGTRIDVDNSACVTPFGILVLSVNRETYLSLGLEGVPWTTSSVNGERYAIIIDLKKEYFKPGKPNYERVNKSFSRFVPLRFDFIMSWEPPEGKGICPSSLASFLNTKGHDVRLCEPTFSYRNEKNVLVPQLITSEPRELIEWLGAFSLGIIAKDSAISDSSSEYLSSFTAPADNCENVSQIVIFQWTGFFTSRKVHQLFNKLKNYTFCKGTIIPWTSLNVIGFSDSPVSWNLKRHSYYTNGDNNYTIFINSEGHFINYKVVPENSKKVKRKKHWIFSSNNDEN